MGTDVNTDTIAKAYARWAPVYDFVFGAVFERAREGGNRGGRANRAEFSRLGVRTGLSLPYYAGASRLVGVDLSEPMLRKAHARVSGLGLRNVEGLLVMDAQKMAFPDNSFDVIMAQLVVTTVPDPEATLDEFLRVLKPGGEIVLVSRVGADKGLRRVLEQQFTPLTRRLGWRLAGIPVGAVRGMGGGPGQRARDGAQPDAAIRTFLAHPVRQGTGARRAAGARPFGGACKRLT